MQRYEVDGAELRFESDFHGWAQKELGLFEGYGRNLDALWDVLTDGTGLMKARKPFELVWHNSELSRERFGERFETILGLFKDASIPVQLK